MKTKYSKLVLAIIIPGLFGFGKLYSGIPVDFSRFNPKSEISIKAAGVNLLIAEWKTSDGGRCEITLDLKNGASLFKSLKAGDNLKEPMSIIASNLQPRFDITIGTRDPAKPWPYIFFDKVDLRLFKSFTGDLSVHSVSVVSDGPYRANIIISKISAGSFNGDLIIKFYSGSPFVLIESAMIVNEPGVAYI